MSSNMSFTIWASGILLLPFGWHFGTVYGFWGTAPASREEFFIRIAVIIILFIIASIALAIFAAMRANEDDFEPDEREAIIIQKAERNGYYALSTGLVLVMWIVFDSMSSMDIANAVLALICLAEIVKILSGLFYLRVGRG